MRKRATDELGELDEVRALTHKKVVADELRKAIGAQRVTPPEMETAAVDTSLVYEMLRLSPAERLRLNDRMAALATKLQEAFSAGRADG